MNNKERKIQVCWFLTSGLMPLRYIYGLPCFSKANGKQVSWKVFRRWMRKLADAEYIKIMSCGYASETFGPEAALLLPLGAKFLTAHVSRLDPCDFRMSSPKPANIDHELRLTDIIREIKYGAAAQKHYDIVSLSDDKQIRLWFKNRNKSLKNEYIADLKAIIKRTKTENEVIERSYYLEYDNGDKGRSYWEPKLLSWDMNIVLITRDAERAFKMVEHLKASSLGICIITHEDFLKIGLLSCVEALERFVKSIFVEGEWKWFA